MRPGRSLAKKRLEEYPILGAMLENLRLELAYYQRAKDSLPVRFGASSPLMEREDARIDSLIAGVSLRIDWGELQRAEIENALQALPARERELLARCYFEGQELGEAAGALGCSERMARDYRAAALDKVAAMIGGS
jgi:DNA-directed RNA polymerase specialized sigma24 family protein